MPTHYIAQRRPDGSFLINSGTYHVPNESEWAGQWAELNAQWQADPDQFEQLAPPPEPTPPTLEEVKAAKLVEINAACDATLTALTGGYPASELLTFDKQETEARAYLADNASPTPLLAALAAGRKIPLPELVAKVLAKADAFAAASGYVIGQRQALEDMLDAAETIEAVQGIEVHLSLPGMVPPEAASDQASPVPVADETVSEGQAPPVVPAPEQEPGAA